MMRTHAHAVALVSVFSFALGSAAFAAEDRKGTRGAIEFVRAVTVEVSVVSRVGNTRRTNFGAGFVIHPRGIVVTSLHVVHAPGMLYVRPTGGRLRHARLLASYSEIDAAILHAPADEDLPAIGLSRGRVEPGLATIVAGVPDLGSRSLRLASVRDQSTAVRYAKVARGTELIRFDADISLGFSGGPMVDLDGRLVGMILARNSGGLRRGYGLPVDRLLDVLGVESVPGSPMPDRAEAASWLTRLGVEAVDPRPAPLPDWIGADPTLSSELEPRLL